MHLHSSCFSFAQFEARLRCGLYSPERKQVVETAAPIAYVSLQARHLGQVHELLERAFWAGVDGE